MLSLYRTYYHLGLARPDEHVLFIQSGLDWMMFSVFNQHKPVLVHHVPLRLLQNNLTLFAVEVDRSSILGTTAMKH